MDTSLLLPCDFLGKSTGVGCHFLLQRIFLTQGSNPGLPYCRQMLYHLSHQGSHSIIYICIHTHTHTHTHKHTCALSHFPHGQLFVTLWTIVHQAPLSMEFFRPKYWSGLPSPSPGDLPNPGMQPASLMSPALTDRFFTTSATWEAPKH